MHTRDYNARWWDRDAVREDAAHESIFAHVSALKDDHSGRLDELEAWHALYRDHPDRQGLTIQDVRGPRRTRFNVIQNGVDTMHSRLTRNRPRPWVVTAGGRSKLQRKAKAANKYIEGEFYRMQIYDLAEEVAKDALVYGTGALKLYEQDGRPAAEVVWCGELLVDPREERARSIRTLYQIKRIDAQVLAATFPDASGVIDTADTVDDPDGYQAQGADIIEVVEAWRLPSGDDAGDGRHVIAVSSGALLDEEWGEDAFPFAFYRWTKDTRSFWGIGLAERMSGAQAELNEINAIVSEAFSLTVPSVWVEAGSNVKREQIDNEVSRLYTYQGTPPLFLTPPAVSNQHVEREQTLIQSAYQMQGISLHSAQSTKPAGLNSGKAIRNHHEVESMRFAAHGRAWEAFFTDVARRIMTLTEQIAEREEEARKNGEEVESKLSVHVGRQNLDAVEFASADLRDEPYDVRVYPISALSATPEGRFQDVQDLIDLGVVSDPNDVRELLDYPDLERFNDVQSAGRRLADRLIERALDGEHVSANPYIPLEYAHKQAVLQWAQAKLEGDDNATGLDRLGNLIGHIETLMQIQQPPAPPMPAPGPSAAPGQPPPMPGPPPQMQ